MIMSGKRNATIAQVQQIDIHGTRYLDIVYILDGQPDTAQRARLGPEATYPNPQAGDKVSLSYVMGVVISVEWQGV